MTKPKVIAILRGFDQTTSLRLVEAYHNGGIEMVEVAFDQSAPETWRETAKTIAAIKARFGKALQVGAGTVLTLEQLELCVEAGGEYMVTPNVNAALIQAGVKRGLRVIAGAMTPSEAVAAWEAGASYVKIFPAGTLGPDYIRAIKIPLSHIPLLAFDGITPDNASLFLKAGCIGVGVGGALANRDLIAAGAYDQIEAIARRFFTLCP